jgi:kinetochore protein Mis13/DSN1
MLRCRELIMAPAYDENDGGFQFARRTSRRTAKAQPEPEPIPEEPVKPAPARRKKNSIAATQEPAEDQPQKRRRSARLSGDKEQLDHPKPPPKTARKAEPTEKRRKKELAPAPEPAEKAPPAVFQTPKQNELHVVKKRDGAATKIMLPFADTPVITRNKEMRKASKDGHRRSSTGLRGRRASSLIDSGMSNGESNRIQSSAVPTRESQGIDLED